MQLRFETKLEKFGGPLKNLCGPPEGRGPPVEKHCFNRPGMALSPFPSSVG